jgi:hypothetical protein
MTRSNAEPLLEASWWLPAWWPKWAEWISKAGGDAMVVVMLVLVGAYGCGLERGRRQLVNMCVRGTVTKTLGPWESVGNCKVDQAGLGHQQARLSPQGLLERKRIKHQGLRRRSRRRRRKEEQEHLA